ncbi:hypothetical protein ACGFJ7_31160 [Actinoplanes sp. NPDC048988]|uniref:hypothetical protein n=1 Tax=Actinoplanes sp. NPDC048988 TaxID=3363901 RepID=UPI003718525A
MNTRSWLNPPVSTKLTAKVLLTILVGFMVNLISTAVSDGITLAKLPEQLGWWMILFPLALILVLYDVAVDVSGERSHLIAEARMQERSRIEVQSACEEMLQISTQVLVKSALFPRRSGPLNIHVFLRDQLEGRTILRKDREILCNVEEMPENYTLDYVFPDVDELVICEAYNQDALKYEVLPEDHLNRYNERISRKVDPKIGWVLALPIHSDHGKPLGVVCAFGTRRFFPNENSRRVFQEILWKYSEMFLVAERASERAARGGY